MLFEPPEKITTRKKMYSRLTDSWNKSQMTVCRVKIRTHQLWLEKITNGKKGTILVCHVYIRTPAITLWFKKILIGFLYFTETMRFKLSVTLYLFLALYGSTTIQSRLFLKNIENFVWFPKQYLLGFFILEKQFANIPDRGFLFLRKTLLLFSLSSYSQTEWLTETQINPGWAG